MNFWIALEYGAWAIAAALMLWMLTDAVRVGSEFSEDVLLSSEEGHDELLREEHHEIDRGQS
jgi:hypothetical protein